MAELLHKCNWVLPRAGYGSAIENCEERENGELWVDNNEYASQVNYCPYCGYKAKKQVEVNK
jgi:hypothetical protein